MSVPYRHTQIGWAIISIAVVLLPILVVSWREGELLYRRPDHP